MLLFRAAVHIDHCPSWAKKITLVDVYVTEVCRVTSRMIAYAPWPPFSIRHQVLYSFELHATAACRQTMRTLLYRSDGLLPKSEHVR